MGLWRFLGGEINYDRVNKRALKDRYWIMDSIIGSILYPAPNSTIEDIIEKETKSLIEIYNFLTKEEILGEYIRLLKVMGADVPTQDKYPEFYRILWYGSVCLPTKRELKRNPHWQENWNHFQQWLKELETPKQESTEYIKSLEQKLQDQEERIKNLEKQNSYEKK